MVCQITSISGAVLPVLMFITTLDEMDGAWGKMLISYSKWFDKSRVSHHEVGERLYCTIYAWCFAVQLEVVQQPQNPSF